MIGTIAVSLGALRHNATLLREAIAPARAAFVVKGNGYGHGLVETALAIEPFAARICVFSVEEALELRDGGITAPILVLGPIPPHLLKDALAAETEIALWNTNEYLRAVTGAARERITHARVHIKINTDLNRLGLEPHELVDALEEYLRHPEIEIAGIYSHLASAEEIDSPYTMHQLSAFDRALTQAKPLLDSRQLAPVRHIAASAAAMLWPQTRLDMVRFGIALYGLWPSPQTRQALESPLDLRPALSYASKVIVVRAIPAGASVGYGGAFHAPHDMRIGVVPVGYADGLPRLLSNKGHVLVDGAVCPIVGRIAMNMTEIDLTAARNARAGSKVTLIGRDGDAEVSADDWASWSDTINYEIVTRLPSEIPREYVA
ncbi:MAG TPA: alanine racemase [Candidatus Baltobacteraceae bacterium]|nr:alanine racemase [Candidatus Baltobacteraceae bacterium]